MMPTDGLVIVLSAGTLGSDGQMYTGMAFRAVASAETLYRYVALMCWNGVVTIDRRYRLSCSTNGSIMKNGLPHAPANRSFGLVGRPVRPLNVAAGGNRP